jgi:hypothetical protein
MITRMLVGGMSDPSLRYCRLTLQFEVEEEWWGWLAGWLRPYPFIRFNIN